MSADRADSRHDFYRQRLAALATDIGPARAIIEAGHRNGWWSTEQRWARAYGRFIPDHEPFVTLVFQVDSDPQLLCHVEVFTGRPPTADGPSSVVVEKEEGWLRVTPFPADHALPTLPAVLASPGRRTVVRYRPHSRCTIRFEAPDGRVHFAKVFRDDGGARSHVNNGMLWQAASRNELDFMVAPPERWDARTRALWQGGIAGVALTARHLEEAGAYLARRMGRAAASLTRSLVQPHLVYDLAAHCGRSIGYATDLCVRVPRLTGAVDRLMKVLAKAQAKVRAHVMRPIHGSLSRTQWIEGTSQLGLVDFDKLAIGDPEFDVAAFSTELDYERLEGDQIQRAFRASYEDLAGPLDRRLLELYAAHERLEKALKAARAVRPDGDLRAEAHLERALAECSGATA